MTISSISTQVAGLAMRSAQYASPGKEAREVGPDRDGDADDASRAVAPAAASVNPQGQTVGTMINATA